MSEGSRMTQVPISQPAPQPSPCEPSPTADDIVRSLGGNHCAERSVKMLPIAGPAAALSDCPTTIQW